MKKKNYILLLLQFTFVILIAFVQGQSNVMITLTILNQTPIVVYGNSSYNQQFTLVSDTFNCSINKIYTYKQNYQSYSANTPITLKLTNYNSNTNVSIRGVYGSTSPSIQPTSCLANQTCSLTINNNCPLGLNMFNYFDRIQVYISGFQTLTYYIICNTDYTPNTFQWGIVLQIIICTILIGVTAIYSVAWSLHGNGIVLNLWLIITLLILLILAGVVGYFSMYALNIIADVLSWIIGTIGICICVMETLFLLKLQIMSIQIANLKVYKLNVLHIISFFVGLGIVMGWWFSGKNWILNDVLFICVTIALIKIFKFINFKTAVISFVIFIVVELVLIIIIRQLSKQSYNEFLINLLNAPFQLQLPTINPVYNSKCAWIPITSIAYPGILLSYLRRFDTSRSTIIYLTIGIIVFFIGSFLWLIISLFSQFSLPFGLITQTATILLVLLFAYRRKQIRTVWDGRFYDEEFADKKAIQNLKIQLDRFKDTQMSIMNSNFKGMLVNNHDQSEVEQQNGGPI